ncbi:MAG TPA: peptidoglycan-binding domain-containing protein [Candidatus Paceibacterota bacterium]
MSTPTWFKRDIYRVTTEFERTAVTHVQRVMRCPETGELDEATSGHLRGLQSLFGLQVTGILDGATAEQIERIRVWGSTEG